jgi:D-tyrosyl-tRNA(Tyr) deacylase
MRVVVQRVRYARVSVDGSIRAAIPCGMLILVGVGQGDGEAEVASLAEKCSELRMFEDSQGKTNLAAGEVGAQALVVSQFTLYADTRKGRRPSFTRAAAPEMAEPLVRRFAEVMAARGIPTQLGQFGAHMIVELENDGPFTLTLESEAHF